MLTAGQAAALIAAISFAALACAGVYTLIKLARLISQASRAVADVRADTDSLLARANAAVDQAHEQLTRTDAITANMDEVSANLAALSSGVSMLLGGPLGRLAGLTYGVRRAIALRRAGPRANRGARAEAGRPRTPVTSGTTRPPAALPPPAPPDGLRDIGETGRAARGRIGKVAR